MNQDFENFIKAIEENIKSYKHNLEGLVESVKNDEFKEPSDITRSYVYFFHEQFNNSESFFVELINDGNSLAAVPNISIYSFARTVFMQSLADNKDPLVLADETIANFESMGNKFIEDTRRSYEFNSAMLEGNKPS